MVRINHMRSLGQQSARGVAWLFAQSGSTRVIGFLSQMLLARLLTPGDFGEVAFLSGLSAVMNTLAGFGIDDVVVSRMRCLRVWTMPALWLSLICSLSGALGLLAISPVVARFENGPHTTRLLALLAISLPISGMTGVPNALLRADLRFRILAAYGMAEFLGAQLLTILLAWRGFGSFSFFLPVPLFAAVRAAVVWSLTKPVLHWRFRLWPMRVLAGNGMAVLGQRLLVTARENGDYLLLGVLAKKTDLGLYFLSFRFAAVPVYTLVSGLSSVLFPALAKLRTDPVRQRAAVLSASRALALTVIPLSFLQAAVAPSLLRLLFGEKWMGAAGMLGILTIGLAFDAIPCVAGALLTANGRFRLQWQWSAVTIVVFFALIGAGYAAMGVFGVACGVATFFLVTAPAYSYLAFRLLGVTWREIAGIYLPPLVCSAVAVALGGFVARFSRLEGRDLTTIGVLGALFVATYAPAVRWLSPAATRDTLQKFALLRGRAA